MKQILAATSSMLARMRELEITANNLSNVNTPGYKRDRYFANILDQQQRIQAGTGFMQDGVYLEDQSRVDLSQGPLDETGNPLDLGINGSGFFVLEDEVQGEVYSRSGDFMMDDSRYLITSSGRRVLGEGGPVRIPPGNLTVSGNGEILVDGKYVDQLRVVVPDETQDILKQGNCEYLFTINPDERPGEIVQGFIERSNVNPVESMVRLVTLQRDFDTNQKVIQSLDGINKIAANQVGKL
mgnify:CR=1 FL=1